MTQTERLALVSVFRALNGAQEGDSFVALLGHIWNVDVDDDGQMGEFCQRLAVTLEMVSDLWREYGIPDIDKRWSEVDE